jgi:predicted ArsR family transcriptional regulator
MGKIQYAGRVSESRGPRPARTDRPRPAALRVLRALSDFDGAITIAELSSRLGGHPNTVRNQLEQLVTTGFAAAQTPPPGRRGRPSRRYRLTLAGQQVVDQDELPATDQQALVEAVSEQLATLPDPPAAAIALGRAWGERLAARDPEPHPTVVRVLARQGFTPATIAEGILLRTCPLLDAARRRPEVVCGIHQGMLAAASGRAVTLLPFAHPDGCLARTVG